MASLGQGDVLTSSLLPSVGGQGSEQSYFSLIDRETGFSAIRRDYNNKISQRNVSSKEESKLTLLCYSLLQYGRKYSISHYYGD